MDIFNGERKGGIKCIGRPIEGTWGGRFGEDAGAKVK